MSGTTSSIGNLLRNTWNYTDIKTRIIVPVMIVLGMMIALTGYNFYQSERARLYDELNLRGQVLTSSISAYATNSMAPARKSELDDHIKAFIEDKKLLHHVSIFQNQTEYLTITSGNLREKLLPETLKHYKLPIFSLDGKNEIGSVEVALSTQEADKYLEERLFQIIFLSFVVIIICIILLSMLLSFVVIRPLERLTNKIQAISMGHLSDKVVSMSWDEIGHLFRDINHMRVRFKKKETDFIESLAKRNRFKAINIADFNCTALVVDDDDTVRAIAQKLLEKNHFTVSTATNGKHAMDVLKHEKFDLILLDLMMPEMTGFDVLKRLKGDSAYSNIPIIVVSSITDKESIVQALNDGATDFIIKPFNHGELIARINIHMSKYLSDRELDNLLKEEINSLKS